MMTFTNEIIEGMSFEKIPNETEFEATFNLIRVYQVEGIRPEEIGANSFADLSQNNSEFSFGFGNSLNEVCQYLCNEDFDDEKELI